MSRYRDPQPQVGINYLRVNDLNKKNYVNLANSTQIPPSYILIWNTNKIAKNCYRLDLHWRFFIWIFYFNMSVPCYQWLFQVIPLKREWILNGSIVDYTDMSSVTYDLGGGETISTGTKERLRQDKWSIWRH